MSDDTESEILNKFKKERDGRYIKGEDEDNKKFEEKKKIFNLVVNIMFGEDQIKEIKKFNDNEINEKNDIQNLSVENVERLCEAVFVKVEKIYEKLHPSPKTEKENTEEKEKNNSTTEEQKNEVAATRQLNTTQETIGKNTGINDDILDENIFDLFETENASTSNKKIGGSFPPPPSKKYKLVKK